MRLCMRLDIDTLADCRTLPTVLETLERHNARATFFVTTGPDRAWRNLPAYTLRPWRLMVKRVWRRYGIRSLVGSLRRPVRVEAAADIRGICDRGHEVSLHGYEHTLWIRGFRDMRKEQLEGWIEKGLRAFEAAGGRRPVGFASPGFTVSSELLFALDRFGFEYSSDVMGTRPFYPIVGGKSLRTPQIPVMVDIEAQVEERGIEGYIRGIRGLARLREDVTAYMHPSYCLVVSEVLERTLEEADAFTTFGEVAHSL